MSTAVLKRPASDNARLDVRVNGRAHIPAWVVDHESYRRWARSKDAPELGRLAFLNGTIWVDLTMEQVFSHNAVRTEIVRALADSVRQRDLGYLFSDGALLSHPAAGLSSEPDAFFLSYATVQSNEARWVAGAEEGIVEIEGQADMTLEVVSTSSVVKDTVDLKSLYWQAGVAEYWLVDARGAEPKFSLLKHAAKGYVESRRLADGWTKSIVFGQAVRLVQTKDRLGNPRYSLEMK